MTLLPEVSVHDVEGTPTLVMHGDTLCTGDVEYQRFRAQARDPAWQRAVLSQSLAQRRALAERARAESERHVTASMASIMDVDGVAVAGAMRDAGVARLVHGHTHRRASHAFDVDGRAAERLVLGDWYERGSVLEVRADAVRFLQY
jgi:UDP-2,3-diacylglucosamine hydrolase